MVAKKLKIPNIGGPAKSAQAMKLVQAKTKRGRRILDARAPKSVSASHTAVCASHRIHACIHCIKSAVMTSLLTPLLRGPSGSLKVKPLKPLSRFLQLPSSTLHASRRYEFAT